MPGRRPYHFKHKPPWVHDDQRRRRSGLLFLRFVWMFGLFPIIGIMGLVTLVYLTTNLLGGGQTALLIWGAICGLSITLPMVLVFVALQVIRRVVRPLAELMQVAERVAEGDLDVRVHEGHPGEFGGLARAFNRMLNELQRSDELRRNMTADVAHELRTPLHIIQGNLEGVLDGVYRPDSNHMHSTLDATRQLARLIDDLQVLSMAESGQLILRQEAISLTELLNDLATTFSGQADALDIELKVQLPAQDTHVFVDVGRMNQVLGNLLVNALRHTHSKGTVNLIGERKPDHVQIKVHDTGTGIAAENLPHVFDRFWRGDPARSHAEGVGGGLGLAIAQQLVKLHDGAIRVESTLDIGTTFTIDLPMRELGD